jgi:hypothetical protein
MKWNLQACAFGFVGLKLGASLVESTSWRAALDGLIAFIMPF